MLQIGLTGGIGSGKSLVAKIVQTLSFPVFYSDAEAKKIVNENSSVRGQIIQLLGQEAYAENGYNSVYVAQKVFGQPELLHQLNQIIHPAVRLAFQDFAAQQDAPFVFNEAAILFETGAYKTFDVMVLVCSPEELRLKRTQNRDQISAEAVKLRMSKQWTDDQKRPLADFVIENNEQDSLLVQIQEMLAFLKTRIT